MFTLKVILSLLYFGLFGLQLCVGVIPHNTSKQAALGLEVLLRDNAPVRKARILLASQDVAGPILNGGIGTAVRNLASQLVSFGHNVSILYSLGEYVSPNNPRTWAQWQSFYRDSYGVTLVSTPRKFTYKNEGSSGAVRMSYEVYLWLQAHSNEFDFVHFPEWQGTGYFALLAKKQGLHFANTLFVVQAHSPSLWALVGNKMLPDELDFFDRSFMERKSVQLADYLISPSRYMINWMVSNGWELPPNTFVLANTMVYNASKALPPRNNTCLGPWEFVFFGRLEERKGVFLFINAVQGLLKETVPPFNIHIVGKVVTTSFSEIRTLVSKLGKVVNVTLHTTFSVEESRDFFKANPCRVAVMPSLYDNLPYTVMECLVNRIHFITSDAGGAAELLHSSMVSLLTFHPTVLDLQRKLAFVLRNGLPLGQASAKPEDIVATWSAWHDQTFPSVLSSRPPHEPFVSVIMTTFNQETIILMQAVVSLEQQNYPKDRYEVILVNDAGESLAVRKDLSALRVLFQERSWTIVELANNVYLGAARNEGVRRSNGHFLMFMDDDNIAKPSELQTFASVQARTRADVLTCHFDSFDTPTPPASSSNRWIPTGNTETSWAVNSLGDANFFISRAAFDALGGFSEERLAFEDWEFLVKAHLSGYDVQVLPEPLFWKRQSNNSMLHKQDVFFSEYRAFRPYLAVGGHTASALLLAKASFDRTSAQGTLINTAIDFKPYQGYKGLYHVFRISGTLAWRELSVGSRSWNSGAPVFVAEKGDAHFGPLAVTQFNMHPVRNVFLHLEVAKLWVSSFQGIVSVTGTTALSFPGGGGVVIRLMHLNKIILEQSLNDTIPTLDVSVTISVRVKDELAFVVSVLGAHDYFCTTWSRFEVIAQSDESDQRQDMQRIPSARQQLDKTCVPSFFIVGVQQCGTNTLAEAIVESSVSPIVDHGVPNFFMSKANLTSYPCAMTGITFDKSPSYFMSAKAAARIALVTPNPKILVVVCDPAIRLWLVYDHLRQFRSEPAFANLQFALDLPFFEFVQSIQSKKQTYSLVDVGFYVKHIQLWTSLFGSDNVFVVPRENFQFDATTIESVLRFLGVRPNYSGHNFSDVRAERAFAATNLSSKELSMVRTLYGHSWADFRSKVPT